MATLSPRLAPRPITHRLRAVRTLRVIPPSGGAASRFAPCKITRFSALLAGLGQTRAMALRVPAWLGLTFGELFVVVFLAVLIVSAGYWPKMGAWLAEKIASRKKENSPKLTDK